MRMFIAKDGYGRSFDELDAMKMHMFARNIVGHGNSYTVLAEDGFPLCGHFGRNQPLTSYFVAPGWTAQASERTA